MDPYDSLESHDTFCMLAVFFAFFLLALPGQHSSPYLKIEFKLSNLAKADSVLIQLPFSVDSKMLKSISN